MTAAIRFFIAMIAGTFAVLSASAHAQSLQKPSPLIYKKTRTQGSTAVQHHYGSQTPINGAGAWPTEHNWTDFVPGTNQTYLEKYSDYMKDVPQTVFTAEDSDLHGVKVNCSRSNEALYVKFAHDNHLPFAIQLGKRSDGSQILLTNENTPVAGRTERERLFNFVNTVLDKGNVTTTTLQRDSFPVSVDRKYMTAGKFMLYFSDLKGQKDLTRHTLTITDISESGVITTMAATETNVPQFLTAMKRIESPPYTDGEDGIRGYRHYHYDFQTHQYSLIPLSQEPGSAEYARAHGEIYNSQYDRSKFPRDGFQWSNALQSQISLKDSDGHAIKMSWGEELDGLIDSVCDKLHRREEVYALGAKHLKESGHSCADKTEWEDYSTVSLDEKIWDRFREIDEVVKRYRDSERSFEKLRRERDEQFQLCAMTTIDPRLDLRWLRRIYKHRFASADPADTLQQRWGLYSEKAGSGGINLDDDPNAGRTPFDEDWSGDPAKPGQYDKRVVSFSSCSNVADKMSPNHNETLISQDYNSSSSSSGDYFAPHLTAPVIQAPVIQVNKPATQPTQQAQAAQQAQPAPAPAPQKSAANDWFGQIH